MRKKNIHPNLFYEVLCFPKPGKGIIGKENYKPAPFMNMCENNLKKT